MAGTLPFRCSQPGTAAGPRTTRNWVRDAIARKATNLKNDPETKKKCVRVVYADGYQCDFPVFRRRWTKVGWEYELSSGDEWVGSDPAEMNKWIEKMVSESPQTSGSHQLRRIIRLGKLISKTHSSRLKRKFPGGLVATALFVEAYKAVDARDDEAFRETLRTLSNRAEHLPVYANDVLVSDDMDADRIGRLIDQAKESVQELDRLDADDATDADANRIWKTVFRHSFFKENAKDVANSAAAPVEKKSALGSSAGLAAAFTASQTVAALSDSERQSRMEAAVIARKDSGSGGKPWSK